MVKPLEIDELWFERIARSLNGLEYGVVQSSSPTAESCRSTEPKEAVSQRKPIPRARSPLPKPRPR